VDLQWPLHTRVIWVTHVRHEIVDSEEDR